MFKHNGTDIRLETQSEIRRRMAAYDRLPAEARAQLQLTGEDPLAGPAASMAALLAVGGTKTAAVA